MIFLSNPGGDVARARDKKGRFKKAPKRRASPKPKAARRRKSNPQRRKTVARKMPPRHKSGPKKGQFKKAGGGGGRKHSTASRSSSRKRSYRRNPPRAKGIVANLTDGAIGAAQVLTGKAVVRMGADLLPANLRTGQMVGPAVQVALAILIGTLAEQFVSKKTAHMLLVGGFVAPVEELIVAANVPFLSPALSAYPQLRAYPQDLLTDGSALGLSAYPQGMESYDVAGYGAGGY